MIYMRGLQAKDLVAIVDFIYHGEANNFQADLDGFLALAEELQLKGLEMAKDETLDTFQDQTRPDQSKFQQRPMSGQEEYNFKPQMSEESDANIINRDLTEEKADLPLQNKKGRSAYQPLHI